MATTFLIRQVGLPASFLIRQVGLPATFLNRQLDLPGREEERGDDIRRVRVKSAERACAGSRGTAEIQSRSCEVQLRHSRDTVEIQPSAPMHAAAAPDHVSARTDTT